MQRLTLKPERAGNQLHLTVQPLSLEQKPRAARPVTGQTVSEEVLVQQNNCRQASAED